MEVEVEVEEEEGLQLGKEGWCCVVFSILGDQNEEILGGNEGYEKLRRE